MAKKILYEVEIRGTTEQAAELTKLEGAIRKNNQELKALNKEERIHGKLTQQQLKRAGELNVNINAQRNAYNDLKASILKNNDALRKNSGFVAGVKKGMMQALGTVAKLTAAYYAASKALDALATINKDIIKIYNADRKAAIVFGDSLGYVTKQAKENANAIGLTRREYTSAAAATQDLLVPLGLSRDKAAEFSTELTNLSGSLSVWDTKQRSSTEISEILTKALLGEAEQAKSLGILIDQSSKAYNTRIKALMRTNNITKEQAKAMDILEQITTKTADAQANFASDTENMGMQQAEASAVMREQYELLIENLTPAFTTATQVITGFVTAFNGLFQVDEAVSAQQKLDETLKGTFNQAQERIELTKREVIENEFWLKSYKTRLNALTKELGAGKLSKQVYVERLQAMGAEKQARERQIDIDRQYLDLVLANRDAIRGLGDDAGELVDANGNVITSTKGLIHSLNEQKKTLNEALSAATSIDEIRGIQRELIGVEKQLKKILTIPSEEKSVDVEVSFKTDGGESMVDGFRSELDKLESIYKELNLEIPEEENPYQKLEDAQDKYIKKVAEEEEVARQDRIRLEEQAQATITNAAFGSMQQLIRAEANARNAAIDKRTNKELQALQNQLDAGLINQKEYEKQAEEIRKEANEKKRQSMIGQAIAATALAVIQALATVQPTVPAGAAAAAAAGIQGAVQVGIISSQQFAKGGKHEGAAHGHGGVWAEFEGGEATINKHDLADQSKYWAYGTKSQIASKINSGYGVSWDRGAQMTKAPSINSDLFEAISLMKSISLNSTSFNDENITTELRKSRKTSERGFNSLSRTIQKRQQGYV